MTMKLYFHISRGIWILLGVVSALKPNPKVRVGVIGGGVGGLVVAGKLAKDKDKYEVTILETNDEVGGRMNSQTLDTSLGSFRFDTGPSLLLLPRVYQTTLEELGNVMPEMLPVEPLYKVYFEGEEEQSIDLSSAPGAIEAVFSQQLRVEGVDVAASFRRYKRIAQRFLNFGLPVVIEEKSLFDASVGWRKTVEFVSACIEAFPLLSHDTMIQSVFRLHDSDKDNINDNNDVDDDDDDDDGKWTNAKKIRAVLSFQDLYVGLSPQRTPAVFSLLQALEYSQGIFYPRGGFEQVTNALESACRDSGVEVRTNTRVTGLLVDPDSARVTSLLLQTQQQQQQQLLPVDILVSNVDAPRAEQILFGTTSTNMTLCGDRDYSEGRTTDGELSCSVVSIHLALDTDVLSSLLAHHTLFLSSRITTSWHNTEQGRGGFNPESGVNFYVHAPSRTDASACPLGCDAITVLVPVPPLPDSDTLCVDSITDLVIKRLEACPGMPEEGLRSHIVAHEVTTPHQWSERYNLFGGSVFGLAHKLSQLSLLRPRHQHPLLRNAFRVGASTRPGNGVPLVMIGAALATNTIVKATTSLMRGEGGGGGGEASHYPPHGGIGGYNYPPGGGGGGEACREK
jgi:phytoene desaturase (3,4-didehydrolycopene-forming)